ncbi:MAG: hypothetical protein ACLQBB_14175 [Solirubrobacteraceae bacterium]
MSATDAPIDEASSQGYQALVDHAELELELAGRGQLGELAALGERWDQLVAALPAPGAATALPAVQLLERAHLIHERTRVELMRLRESLLADVATARRARRTADGYAGELAARPRVDRSA